MMRALCISLSILSLFGLFDDKVRSEAGFLSMATACNTRPMLAVFSMLCFVICDGVGMNAADAKRSHAA